MITRAKDGSAWRIGTDAEVAWIATSTTQGIRRSQIYEGTNQIQRVVVARQLLKG